MAHTIGHGMQTNLTSIEIHARGAERVRIPICEVEFTLGIPLEIVSRLKPHSQTRIFFTEIADYLFEFEDRIKHFAKFVLQVVVIGPFRGVPCLFQ